MTRQQKLVILIMALIDLTIIGGLASHVIFFSAQSPSGSGRDISDISQPTGNGETCAATLLHELRDTGLLVTAHWDDVRSMIQVHVSPSTVSDTRMELIQQPETHSESLAAVAADGAQILWYILDRLPHPLPGACRVPETFTLIVCTESEGHQCYVMACHGTTLASWLAKDLSDEEFARDAHYREIRTP